MSHTENRFRIRLQPKSSRRGIDGLQEGALKVFVNSPPEGGKANAELIAVLAKRAGCAKSSVEIVSGLTSRNKTVEISDVAAAAALRSLIDDLAEKAQ